MKSQSYWNVVWEEFRKNRLAMAALFLIAFLVAIAIFAPIIANNKPYVYIDENRNIFFPLFIDYPQFRGIDFRSDECKGIKIFPPIPYSYSEYNLEEILMPPDRRHIMGTDEKGRDLAARMIYGTRVSLLVGFIAVAIYVTIGIIIGSIAGYYGGWVDMIISRFIEMVICFPTFFLILTILALWGPSLVSVMVVIGITGWPSVARIVRGEFFKLREFDFITASRAIGARDLSIIIRHMLPNAMAPILVTASFGVASTILIESSLSFLGLGVQPPTPSWGQILSNSNQFLDIAWWMTVIPGFAIFLTITAYNLIGEGIQEAIDPQKRRLYFAHKN
ncbi:MAG: ABC transporter permease [Spirochaetes bacterium]|nr:ABC transporter permease [Spirochaetota bacterium]